jgi:hypothetical protein
VLISCLNRQLWTEKESDAFSLRGVSDKLTQKRPHTGNLHVKKRSGGSRRD